MRVNDSLIGALTASDRDVLYGLKPDLLPITRGSLTPDDLTQDWYEF